MRDHRFFLKPAYGDSHALIIGIDKYKTVNPLGYAVSDATAIRDLLINDYSFPSENVQYLADEDATKANILKAYMSFGADKINADDRIFIFFAGHGHTITGSRGEVGFLIPHDADDSDLSTLIRWDDLTRNSELIRAKHLFFVMDACYSGLAISRNVHAGSTRFLKDMMMRVSRQVLTAGKANEQVADSGGPIPDHSIFTGHLIEGLQGKAATANGVITANGLMSYVYEKVANDQNSDQTPHYGTIEGDGDFIFKAPDIIEQRDGEGKDVDTLLVIPYIETETRIETSDEKISRVKKLLADDSSTILLHDLITEEVRAFLSTTNSDMFSPNVDLDISRLAERLAYYEEVSHDLSQIAACIAHWAKPAHQPILKKLITRSTDRFDTHSGQTLLLNLRWYPITIEFYSAGIAAVSGGRYDTLENIFNIENDTYDPLLQTSNLLDIITGNNLELTRTKLFNRIPDYKDRYTPFSDYVFKLLQPRLDDALFLGKRYERAFNEFEMLYGLAIAFRNRANERSAWGPVGRFGWKHREFSGFKNTAIQQGKDWAPWKAGVFKGDYNLFLTALDEYAGYVARLNWN